MAKLSLVITISIVASIFLVFLIWQFIFSIYEVKYEYNFMHNTLEKDTEYLIECVGVNFLGWAIKYRDFECKYKIEEGSDLIVILNSDNNNNFYFKTLDKGILIMRIFSKYSLNPTKIKLSIEK